MKIDAEKYAALLALKPKTSGMVIRCRFCGEQLPDEAFNWPTVSDCYDWCKVKASDRRQIFTTRRG